LQAHFSRRRQTIEKEQHILEVWSDWYVKAVGKMIDINTGGITDAISKKIEASQKQIGDNMRLFTQSLAAK